MGSDRARVTYDRKQQYRSVVMQQGRVTLEADWNESQQITNEEIRSEALDFVGPCGTPDDGYGVILTQSPTTPPYDFYIREGTMYVGGLRASLLAPVQYSSQPDWQDYGPEDPDWVDLSSLAQAPPTDEFVYLYLREQEVSAVEDPDLKDIALGGPDTAQRTRLLQRIPRVRCTGTDCVSGLDAAEGRWATEGLIFDPDTMRLNSWSTLAVGPANQPPAQTPCQPQAQGGYIDPDNQLIRVQISGVDPITGNPKFLWGFDDASFLYRIQLDPHDPQNLILQSVPVDSYHQPVRGQAVEVLRTAAELPNGGDVAALSGFVFTLDKNYNPDSQSVIVPTSVSLPTDYVTANQSPALPLFLRVWQQEIVFTPGAAASLGDTGLAVTLQSIGNRPFHLGDYWLFAVRPATPQMVYPERYWNSFQPPDGPRLWACPLGVIAWSQEVGTLVSDCRNQFDNLVELSKRQQGCCTITVRPQDLSANLTLQSIVNKAANETMLVVAANPGAAGNNIQVGLSNVQLGSNPPTFDLTVTETDIYLGQTTSGIEGVIGDEEGGPNLGLAHILVGSLNPALVPLNNQTVTFTGGAANASAQVNIMDRSNQQTVFTLQARNPGVDGNLTTATISNVDSSGSPNTFALTVSWTKTLTGLDMGTLQQSIQTSLGYEITASAPQKVSPSFPIEGTTTLAGGTDFSPGVNATYAQARIFGRPSTICLRPGSYRLTQPLQLGPEHSNITIESCGGSSTISAAVGKEANFTQGLMQLNGAKNIKLCGLTFALPQVLLFQVGGALGGLNGAALTQIGEAGLLSLNSSIGLMVSGCDGLQIEQCIFNYPALQLNDLLFATGILAGADCANVKLVGNVFEGPASINSMSDTTGSTFSVALSAGYIQSDTLQFQSARLKSSAAVGAAGSFISSSLDDILVTENTFENLAFPVVISTVMGLGRFEGNRVKSCLTGFTIAPLSFVLQTQAPLDSLSNSTLDARLRAVANPALQRMMSIAAVYPRPEVLVPHNVVLFNAAEKTVATPAANVTASAVLGRVFTVAPSTAPNPIPPSAAPSPAAGTGTPTPAPTPTPTPTPETLRFVQQPPLTAHVSSLLQRVNTASIGHIGGFFGLTFDIHFLNNDIEAVVAQGGSFYSLLIVNIGKSTGSAGSSRGTLILTGNKMHSASAFLTALAMVDYSAVTANQIFNTHFSSIIRAGSISLIIDVPDSSGANVAQAAVTGNVFIGTAILPPRTAATPALPDWITYNAQL